MKHATTCHTIPLRPKNDIYIFSIQPLTTDIYLATCSDDHITAFNTSNQTPSPILWSLPTGHTGITCALTKTLSTTPLLLTTGQDGTINLWDPLRTPPSPIQTLTPPSPIPILSLATPLSTSSPLLASGSELSGPDAVITFWDLRQPGQMVQRYTESHSDDITALAFHAEKPELLLSGSTDGLLNVYDSRVADEDDAVIQVVNHGAGIAKAGFCEAESVVWGVSGDERLGLYGLMEGAPAEPPTEEEGETNEWVFGDVRMLLGCDYVIDVLTPTEGGMIVGAGSWSEGRVDLVPLRRTPVWDFVLDDVVRLDKGLGEEVVRSVYIDHQNERVVAGAEDNLVRIWSGFT